LLDQSNLFQSVPSAVESEFVKSKQAYSVADYLNEFDIKDMSDGKGADFKYALKHENKLKFNATNAFKGEGNQTDRNLVNKLRNPKDTVQGY